MPNNVEERIVEMRIDNKKFESGAKQTISTLEKLEKALHIKGDSKALDEASNSVQKLGKAVDQFDASAMSNSLEKVKVSFSALEVAGLRVIQNLTDSVYNFATSTIKGLTIDPVKQGWGKYEDKTASVQTIMNATGDSIEKVNEYLETLMWFSDETSFGFTDMTAALGQMSSAGGDVKKLIPLIMGIGNAVAFAGKGSAEFSRSIYNLNQSYSGGFLNYADWRSLQLAGVTSKQLEETLINTGVALGKIKEGEVTLSNFTETLKDKWADTDVMEKAFGYFSEISIKAKELIDAGQFDNATDAYNYLASSFDFVQSKAALAAQQAKSFQEVIDATKDAVSTGWLTTFEHMFGNYEIATDFWTEVVDRFWNIFATGGKNRNKIFEIAFGSSGKEATEALEKTVTGWGKLESRIKASGHTMAQFESAFRKVTAESGNANLSTIIDRYGSIQKAFEAGAVAADVFKKVLAELSGQATDTSEEVEESAIESVHSLEEMRKVALEVLRGEHGNGDIRKQWYAENGYDEEIIQAMVGQLSGGNENISDDRLMALMEEYYRWRYTGDKTGKETFADYVASGASGVGKAAEKVEETVDLLEEADELLGGFKQELDDIYNSADTMEGGDAFRGGLLNMLDTVVAFKEMIGVAFENVFGTVEERGARLKHLLNVFYKITDFMKPSEDALLGIQKIVETLFRVFKIFGTVGGGALKIVANAFMAFKGIVDDVLAMIGRNEFSIGEVLDSINEHIKEIIPSGDKVRDSIKNLGKSALKLLPTEKQIADFINRVKTEGPIALKSFKQFFSVENLKKYTPSLNKVKNIYKQFTGYLKTNYPTITAWFSNLKKTSLLGGAFEKLTSIFTKFGTVIGSLNFSADGIKEALSILSETFGSVVETLFGDPEELKKKVETALETVFETLREKLAGVTLQDIFKAIKLAALMVFLGKLSEVFEAFRKVGNQMVGISQSISEMFGSVSDVLQAYRKNIQANAYIKMAAAIGILAAAMFVLSKIPEEKLTHVVVTLSYVILTLSLLANKLGGINKIIGDGDTLKINVFNGLAAKLIGLAAVLAVLAGAIVSFKKNEINKNDILKVMITLGIFMLAFGGFAAWMKRVDFNNSKSSVIMMLGLILALRMMIKPINKLAEIAAGEGRLRSAIAALGIIMAFMTAMMAVLSLFNGSGRKTKNGMIMSNANGLIKAAGGLVLMALAIRMLIKPIQSLAELAASDKSLTKGLISLGLIMLAMSVFAAGLSFTNGGNFLKAAAGMALMALAIDLLLPAILTLTGAVVGLATSVPWENMTNRLEAFHDALTPLGELAIIMVGFGFAAVLLGIGVGAIGIAMVTGALGVGIFALAIWLLTKAFNGLTEVFPKIVEGFEKVGDLWSNEDNRKKILVGAAAFVVLALAIAALAKVLSYGKLGSGFTRFTTTVLLGITDLVTKMGSKILDLAPSILGVIGALLVLAALYFVGIIPDLTEIFVQGIVTLFSSIATSVDKHKDELVESITSIGKSLLKLISGVIEELFTGEFWNSLDLFEKILLGIAGASTGISILANLVKPFERFKNLLGGEGGGGGILSAAGGVKDMIGKLVEAAGGLLPVLGIVAALTAALAYAIDNTNKQQDILRETAFDGLAEDAEGYAEAIAKTQARIDELDESLKLYGPSELTSQELSAQELLLKTLQKEYEELQKQAETVAEAGEDAADVADVVESARHRPGDSPPPPVVTTTPDDADNIYAAADAAEDATGKFGKLAMSVEEAKGFLTDMFGSAEGFDLNALTDGMDDETIIEYASGLKDTLLEQFQGFGIDEILSQLSPGDTTSLWKSFTEGEGLNIMSGLTGSIDEYGSMFTNAMSALGYSGQDAFASANESHSPSLAYARLAGYIPDGIRQGIMLNAPAARSAVTNLASSMLSIFQAAVSSFVTAGSNLLAGLDSGITSYWNSGVIQEKLSSISSSIIDAMNIGLGVHSPSRFTRKSGQYLLEGLRLGIQDNEDPTITEIIGFSSALIDAISIAMARVGMFADENFDFQPTITPVVDMSNVTTASGSMSEAFSGVYGVSAQMSGSINARLRDVERLASSMEAAGQTINNNGDSFTFNIYPAEGMDENAIADAVMNRMQTRMVRRGAAFG